MSDDAVEVTFTVYYGGSWTTSDAGKDSYIGGENSTFDCKAEELYTIVGNCLGDSFFGKRLWYCYPFEDFKERKVLSARTFSKMCYGARWVKFVNVFVAEATEEHEEDAEIGGEPCEEEERVEGNVDPFTDDDEDEEFDYHNTPPNSDDEEVHVRFKPGSGELKMHQVFESLDEFKDALVEYAFKSGNNIKQNRWGKDKCEAVCGVKESEIPCEWRIYYSYEECIGKYKVKSFEDEHVCTLDGYCKILKSRVIAKLFLDDVRSNPDFKPKTMEEEILKNFNLIVTRDKCRKGKAKALAIIKKEHEEQFFKLKDYRTELIRSNPGSTVELNTVLDDEGT